jgi:glycosyltransferase involved in cell wall biosynthesis
MTGARQVELSVIVPTRNRADSVCRALDALTRQTADPRRFEVVVVPNDCIDDTAARVDALTLPFEHRIVERRDPGMSTARNAGAATAVGRVLVFMDDDIEPPPGFVDAHAEAHTGAGEQVVAVGAYLVPDLPRRPTLLLERLRRLDAEFATHQTDPARPLDWRYAVGGNMSMSASLFASLGGFDDAIATYGGEDYELAIRAEVAGAVFVFAPDADGYHHRRDDHTLDDYLRNARSVGRNDAYIIARHSWVLDALPIGRVDRPRTKLGRLGRILALDHPVAGDAAVVVLRGAGALLAALRWSRPWNRLVDGLYEYWYWRGAGDALGDRAAVSVELASLRRTRSTGC